MSKALRKIVREQNIKLIWIDAIVDTLGEGTDDYSTKQLRKILKPMAAFAREEGIAVLGSIHPNKRTNTTNVRDRIAGSAAYNQVARSTLELIYDPDDEELPKSERRRNLIARKGNHIGEAEMMVWSIVMRPASMKAGTYHYPTVGKVMWSEAPVETIAGLQKTKAEDCMVWMLDYLRDNGPVLKAKVEMAAEKVEGKNYGAEVVRVARERLEADDLMEVIKNPANKRKSLWQAKDLADPDD